VEVFSASEIAALEYRFVPPAAVIGIGSKSVQR
jgi:hypothetical protein